MKNIKTKHGMVPAAMLPLVRKIDQIANKLVGHYDAKQGRLLTLRDGNNIVAGVLEEMQKAEPFAKPSEFLDYLEFTFNDNFFSEIQKNSERIVAELN
tara:strand:+ start:1634 stop:1927 length:294 start_codon:yes stop_codon:yes gene_type:complete